MQTIIPASNIRHTDKVQSFEIGSAGLDVAALEATSRSKIKGEVRASGKIKAKTLANRVRFGRQAPKLNTGQNCASVGLDERQGEGKEYA
jgi:hypothetical protein